MSTRADPRPTIVCVDDDLPLLRSLREQLMRGLDGACAVEFASSGAEALQLLADLAVEGASVPLLICDHIMPGMRGTELLERAHRLYPSLLTVLLTGQADVDAVAQAVNRANLYRLLTKPWQEDDLILTVKEALRRVDQEQKLAQQAQALTASKQRAEHSLQLLQATMDATLDGLLVLDESGAPVQINRQLVELWAIPAAIAQAPPGAALLDHLRAQVQPPSALRLDAQGGPTQASVIDLADGRAIEYLSLAYRLHGQRVGTVFSFRDVTARERSAQRFRHQALHDSLSGLPNRLQFTEALDRAVADCRASGASLGVLFVDLDHFKRINDSMGHDFGDELLKSVAARLAGCLRPGDLTARWGGDEFTVLAPNLRSAEEAEALARRIVTTLDEPFTVGESTLQISASVGLASFPADGEDGQSVLRRADMALYRAKEEGRNGFVSFRPSAFADLDANGGLALEADLRAAIRCKELQLYYQPQIDCRSGHVSGVEALARWHHPQHGWIGPNVFIALAERIGAIVALGEWALDTACRQAAAWQAEGLTFGLMAVNLSAVQFDRSDLPAVIRRVLADSALPAHRLEVEVTEALALRHVGVAAATLQSLRDMGVKVALDDFGTGYASLTYLKQLPCDTLKIDRSFTHDLRAGSKDAAIIRALASLADGLGLRLVAEGVETQQVADTLGALGCRTMQGYLFGRPVDATQLTALLRAQPPTGRRDARVVQVVGTA